MATKRKLTQPDSVGSIDYDALLSHYESSKPADRKPEGAGLMRTMGDMAIKGAQGVVDLGASAVGLGNIVTGGAVGKGMDALGYDPQRTNATMGEYLSSAQKESDAKVQNAQGFVDTVGQAVTEPRFLAGSLMQSLPGILALGGVQGMAARAIAGKAALSTAEGAAAATGKVGDEALKAALATQAGADAAKAAIQANGTKLMALGAAGEGAQTAGGIAQQAQQAGRDYGDYALPSIGAGAMTAAIGAGAGKLMGDAGTKIFTGTGGQSGSMGKQALKSAFSEGALEEMPQSGSEQYFTNIAMGEADRMKGVANAAGTGLVTGAAMGLGMGAMGGGNTPQAPATIPPEVEQVPPSPADALRATKVPENGPMTAAVNAGIESKAQEIEAAIPIPAQQVVEQVPPIEPVQEAPTVEQVPLPIDQAPIQDAFAQREKDRPAEPTGAVQDGDILNKQGAPFRTMMAAMIAKKKAGENHELVRVEGGLVVRPTNVSSNEQNQAQGTDTAPTQAPGETPQVVASDAAAPTELPAEGSGAVEGGGLNQTLAQAEQAPVATENVASEPLTQPAQPGMGEGAGASQPTQTASTKQEQAKADLDHLFGVDDKRAKAIERIAKGAAYFSNPIKAGDFIAKSGLKDTHKVVKVSDKRWDIVAKGDQSKAEQPAAEQAPPVKETPIEVSYAENGKTLKIKDAKKAIADIDSKIQKFKDLIKCLRG